MVKKITLLDKKVLDLVSKEEKNSRNQKELAQSVSRKFRMTRKDVENLLKKVEFKSKYFK